MLRMLRPTYADPKLNRKITLVRALFSLFALGFVALMALLALSGEMPDSVPSTSRRISGAPVTWEASPLEFIIRFLVGLLGGLAGAAFFGVLVEKFVVRRHGARSLLFRKRYPY